MPRAQIRVGNRASLLSFVAGPGAVSRIELHAVIAEGLKRSVIPQLVREAPRRTGTLKRSIRVVYNSREVYIRLAFYARWVKVSNGQTVLDRAFELINQRAFTDFVDSYIINLVFDRFIEQFESKEFL